MTTWITTLATTDAELIWEQVQKLGWWTFNSPRLGGVQAGDDLIVWWSERGWVGWLRAMGTPEPGERSPLGWLHQGKLGIPIQVVGVRETPSRLPAPKEVSSTPLPHAPQVTDAVVLAELHGLFIASDGGPFDGPDDGPVATPAGWSTDQELIKRVEGAAVTFVRQHLANNGWEEVRDRQRDGCGYDLDFRHTTSGDIRHVEVKGTSGPTVRFVLTRLEHRVQRDDPDARIYVVTDALTQPEVRELRHPDLIGLGLEPDRWRVG